MSDVTEAMVKAAAEAMWQAEAMRATGRPRTVAWSDQAEDLKLKWHGLARAALEAAGRVRRDALAQTAEQDEGLCAEIYPPDRATWEGRNRQLEGLLVLQNRLIDRFGLLDRRRDGDPPLTPGRVLALTIDEVAHAREAGRREGWAAACARSAATVEGCASNGRSLPREMAAAIRALAEPGAGILPDMPTKPDAERPDAAEGG